jgi:hypothetical protein
VAWREWKRGFYLIQSLNNQSVRKINGSITNLDEYFARRYLWGLCIYDF